MTFLEASLNIKMLTQNFLVTGAVLSDIYKDVVLKCLYCNMI